MLYESLFHFLYLAILISASAFLTLSEASITSCNKIKIKSLAHQGDKDAKIIYNFLDNYDTLISIISIGNHIFNITTSLATSIFFISSLQNTSQSFIFVLITIFIIILFGEILPKIIANKNPEKIALLLAFPLKQIFLLLTPFIKLLNFLNKILLKIFNINNKNNLPITEEELKTFIEVSHQEGLIEYEEKKMLNNILKFSNIKAKDIMIARLNVKYVCVDDSYNTILKTFEKECFSRLLVYNSSKDNIIGYINLKDIAFLDNKQVKKFKIKKYLRYALLSYEYEDILSILEKMKLKNTHVSIVFDEYGHISGIITLNNLLESIVGNIKDEYRKDNFIKLNNGDYIVNASCSLLKFNNYFKTTLSINNCESIGGYILYHINKLPSKGDYIEVDGLKLTIEEVYKNRIVSIKLSLNNPKNIL